MRYRFENKKGRHCSRQLLCYAINRNLLVKFTSHINVEACNHSRSMKHLFKYINKGLDRATAVLNKNKKTSNEEHVHVEAVLDEIQEYLDCRYISALQSCWRIL